MSYVGRLLGSILQRGAANIFGAPRSVSGLFFAFIVASALSWSLLVFSWWLLALRSRLVRGYSMTLLWWVEIASATAAVLGHFILLFFIVYGQLPLGWLLVCLRLRSRRSSSNAGLPSLYGQGGKDTLKDDLRSSFSLDEEAEERARGWAANVFVPVGNAGGLQQRLTIRTSTTSSLEAKATAAGLSPLHAPAGGVSAAAPSITFFASQKIQERLARFLPFVIVVLVVAIVSIHFIIHQTIPDAHRQSQELLLGIFRVLADGVLLLVCEIFIALRLEMIAAQSHRSSGNGHVPYVRIALFTCSAILAVSAAYSLSRFLWLVFTVDTLKELKKGVISSFDICATEGMKMDPSLAKSWVLPALLHRRLFNFYTGSETCAHADGLPLISFLDAEDHVLLVSPVCHDGTRPRVYLHRPENNEFTGSPDVKLPETSRGNLEYHRQLEELYGTATLAASRKVIVNRDPTTRLILSVEFDPSQLNAQLRKPRTQEERAARQLWPQSSSNAFVIPLGLSAAYTVLCEAANREEYHLFPLDDALLDAYSAGVDGVREAQCLPAWKRAGRTAAPPPLAPDDEPAGNVFILLFDAVSRQEVRRALPKFSQALADFATHRSTRHYVVEAKGAMTLGVNTPGNIVPFFAGITATAVGLSQVVQFTEFSFMERTVFVRAKEKYGDMISTALTSAFCHDLFEYLMGYTVPSSGAGGRVWGIDRYMYQPFCHLDYSGMHSNFRGPYSIVRRCMAGEAVWDHMVSYTEALLAKQMKDGQRAADACSQCPIRAGDCHKTMPDGKYGKNFFHIMYMTEGHEGTHGVLPLVDDSLTRFFHDLRYKLKFFDNPRNTFILLADHGNHMGPYHGSTRAGMFERGTPPTVLIVHPDVLNRIDANKGRKFGTSAKNLRKRKERLSTPLDMYLTLADLLNVPAKMYYTYNTTAVIHPASLFDMRDAKPKSPARSCSQFSSIVEHYPCPLDFCKA